ncbi:MAG: hypothetical protein ABI378_09455 [Chitinophagaceae bacterium]
MKQFHRRYSSEQTDWYALAKELPSDWDEHLPPGHFLGSISLKVNESTDLPDLSWRYLSLRVQGKIIAQAAFQILTVKPYHVNPSSMSRVQSLLWRTYTNTFHPKLLVCGQLFRHDVCSFCYSETMSSFEAYTWYRKAIKMLGKVCGVQAVLVKDSPPDLIPHFQHNAANYLLLRNDISMQMTVPESWKSIGDYEKSLKHKYAQRFRKARQAWVALDVREMNAVEVAENSKQIFSLYRQVAEHQSVCLGLLSEAFIPALKAHFKERLKVWGIFEEETLVAFASAWEQYGSLDMFYIGFDYDTNNQYQLYFNILFFAVEQAIFLKKSELILGRTALEAKARVGCRPVYLNTFLHIRNPILRFVVTKLQNQLGESGNEWEQRHPFKP